MPKNRYYYYDHEACAFVEVKPKRTRLYAQGVAVMLLAFVMAGVMTWGVDEMTATPQELALKAENEALQQQLDRVGRRMQDFSTQIQHLAQSDQELYRTLFQADPISDDVRQVGVGGSDGSASGQIAALEGQINSNMARGWRESHPDIVAARQQIARLRPYAAAERRSGNTGGMSNPSYVSLRAMMGEREAQLAAATARRNQLQADLAQLSSGQSTEPGLAAEQERLGRDYDVLKQQYDQLLANREQVRLRSDVQARTSPINVQVIEPPVVPSSPAAPNRPVFLTAVLILALGAGVAAAFVAGQLQTTFPTQNRLAEVTGLPVLGTLSEVVTPEERARRRQRLIWLGGTGAALAGSWAILILVEFWQRSSAA